MSIKLDKVNKTWMVEVTTGVDSDTGKTRRFIKRGIQTKTEALEIEAFYKKNYSILKNMEEDRYGS
ncbi:Arm DNA-binding domain-containing protein [Vagococcus zengguangii]|uniref:AP2-like integrase N-terminal domain-containing protein n=1 Tax=Vagococcus zengguangii TaxID=2571750 RepID=A0A4D7CS85_9ENTE|nr:Arm DNA-binding domain-containing protein [Vagococcus zengguangii]QCI87115.1 hypothetical protein FA707_09240 [Vagococcus zengguangii]